MTLMMGEQSPAEETFAAKMALPSDEEEELTRERMAVMMGAPGGRGGTDGVALP